LLLSIPNDVHIAFQAYTQGPEYNNREWIEYEKWQRLHVFLDNPTLKTTTPSDATLKHRALAEFQLINRQLYKNPNKTYQEPRYVVSESEAFDITVNEHLQLLHASRDKVLAAIQQRYYGINRQEIAFALKLCKNYALSRPAATKAPLVPIISERA
jgi:hypothetical protein